MKTEITDNPKNLVLIIIMSIFMFFALMGNLTAQTSVTDSAEINQFVCFRYDGGNENIDRSASIPAEKSATMPIARTVRGSIETIRIENEQMELIGKQE